MFTCFLRLLSRVSGFFQVRRVLCSVVLLFLLFLAGGVCRGSGEIPSLGGYSPGQPIQVLKNLGKPFPLDTAGWHTFVNVSEGVLCRFLFRKSGRIWVISSIMLIPVSEFPGSSLFEEHQMLTGDSLRRFGTEKKLHLNEPVEVVKKLHGLPQKRLKGDSGETWVYINSSPTRKGTLIIGIRNDRVAYIQLSEGTD